MLVILSPAKTQDFSKTDIRFNNPPLFADKTAVLVKALKQYAPQELESLLSVSQKLAELNFDRYLQFAPQKYDTSNSKACILAYQGDVYQGLQAETLQPVDLEFANAHLLILSGLYGALRPLDGMQAYRLEMATKFTTPGHKDLYAFWHQTLQDYVNRRLQQEQILINLASNEYSSALDLKKLAGQVITVEFKDWNKDRFKVIGLLAKKARGMMARYMIQNRIDHPEKLQQFNASGYQFQANLSSSTQYIFHRK